MKKLLLFIGFMCWAGFTFSQCTNLFFSEYVEGSGNNKGLEIYNPTANAINLSNYVINRYSNGSLTVTETMSLSGMIEPYDVVVITNGQTDSQWVSSGGYWSVPIDTVLYLLADIHDAGTYPAVCYFNGDDAITLETTSSTVIDIFGKIGEDPGGAWTDDATAGYTDANGGRWWTANHTLVRKYGVKQGVTANPTLFNVTVEWDSLPRDTWDSLGFHSCECYIPIGVNENEKTGRFFLFPNPVIDDQVLIKGTKIISDIEIFDILGKRVLYYFNKSNKGEVLLKFNTINEGIYLIKVRFDNDKEAVQKIFIK